MFIEKLLARSNWGAYPWMYLKTKKYEHLMIIIIHVTFYAVFMNSIKWYESLCFFFYKYILNIYKHKYVRAYA